MIKLVHRQFWFSSAIEPTERNESGKINFTLATMAADEEITLSYDE